jgi:hypothetical protein
MEMWGFPYELCHKSCSADVKKEHIQALFDKFSIAEC